MDIDATARPALGKQARGVTRLRRHRWKRFIAIYDSWAARLTCQYRPKMLCSNGSQTHKLMWPIACALPRLNSRHFAHLLLDYVPGEFLVESKSLKLFLGFFRNHGAFHEDCTISIARLLVDFLNPQWLRIGGYWYPRDGIPIDVFW